MKKTCGLAGSLPLLTAAGIAVAETNEDRPPDDRPNIILILADDMGYSDLGSYGGEIRTPVLDALAYNGVRFTQFYNTSRCSPTRASLLTGVYPHQAGMGWLAGQPRGYPGYAAELSRDVVTLGNVLGDAGYGAYMLGKWHLSSNTGKEGPKDNWPLQRGFHRFYGTILGAGSFFDPASLTRGNTMISPFDDPEYEPEGDYYYTDALNDETVRFIREHRTEYPESPFFVYLAHPAPHWPMHAPEEDIARYEGVYDVGYDVIRRQRFESMIDMGIIDADLRMSETLGDWESFPEEDRAWELRTMEVYAAMIDRMDRGIGRIVDALEEIGELDNTLILFLSDNGAAEEELGRGGRGEARPESPTMVSIPDHVVRSEHDVAVWPNRNREGYPVRQGRGVMAGSDDTYIAYGRNWANVSNTPFRMFKHFSHEGGIATPLVAHWPNGIEGRGELIREPGHLIDIMATLVDLAGAEYPEEYDGRRIAPMEGRSLAPLFRNESFDRGRPLFFEHEGTRAVRDGRWKIVAPGPYYPPRSPMLSGERGDVGYTDWKLFDMENDRTELNNLAQEQPGIVERLADEWQRWAERADVLPLGGYRITREDYSARNVFELEPGAELGPGEAPFLVNTALTITARIASPGDGTIVAHGGEVHGYALYVRDDTLRLAWRHLGKLYEFAADRPLPADAFEARVDFTESGRIIVAIDDRTVAVGLVPPAWERHMPGAGLRVGFDAGPPVGEYRPPNRYQGEIEQVRIERNELSPR